MRRAIRSQPCLLLGFLIQSSFPLHQILVKKEEKTYRPNPRPHATQPTTTTKPTAQIYQSPTAVQTPTHCRCCQLGYLSKFFSTNAIFVHLLLFAATVNKLLHLWPGVEKHHRALFVIIHDKKLPVTKNLLYQVFSCYGEVEKIARFQTMGDFMLE